MSDGETGGGRGGNAGRWGSDIIADALREQKIPYVALVPGASFRGLHDSIVNYLGNETPKMLVCLHEEHSVAIAHGWAQVTNEPMAAITHTNVGLMHATMTIFNAWCDRMPVLVIGAGGPLDAEKRRPWIEWIHTAADQGALVRDYTKWDDSPGSAAAAVESIRRGAMLAATAPMGPVYVNLDVSIQEEWVDASPAFYDADLYKPSAPTRPDPADVDAAYELLAKAKNPLILVGRVSRSEQGWRERVQLAEMFNAGVYSIYNVGGGFPSGHRLNRGMVALTIREPLAGKMREADVILSLDWTDLGGTLEQVWPRGQTLPKIINCSNDFHVHRGWSMDYHKIQPATVRVATTPEAFTSALLEKCQREKRSVPAAPGAASIVGWHHDPAKQGAITLPDLAALFNDVTKDEQVTLVTRPIGWPPAAIKVAHPLDFLGSKGGEGLGAGPGMTVGAALAIRDRHPGRIAVSVLGDGDYLMGTSALWTAASECIPLLIIVANNRSYYNDVVHQERMAKQRGRPVENKWIGQRLDDPAPDIAGLARSLGAEAAGPIADMENLRAALAHALVRVKAGAVYVLDVSVTALTGKEA